MAHSRIKVTEDEHRLLLRHREQARAFNEGIAAAIVALKARFAEQPGISIEEESIINCVAKLRKDSL